MYLIFPCQNWILKTCHLFATQIMMNQVPQVTVLALQYLMTRSKLLAQLLKCQDKTENIVM